MTPTPTSNWEEDLPDEEEPESEDYYRGYNDAAEEALAARRDISNLSTRLDGYDGVIKSVERTVMSNRADLSSKVERSDHMYVSSKVDSTASKVDLAARDLATVSYRLGMTTGRLQNLEDTMNNVVRALERLNEIISPSKKEEKDVEEN